MIHYSLCGVTVGVDCAAADQQRQLHALWQLLFAVQASAGPQNGAAPSAPALTLQFGGGNQAAPQLPPGAEIGRADHLAVAKTTAGFLLRCEDGWLALDVAQGCGAGGLANGFWRQPLEAQREFFLLALLMLVQPHGLYGLHASGVVRNGAGCLVVGAAGHGKTTLALSLVLGGWQLLADDALVVRRAADGSVEALALRRGFSCTPQTVRWFPALAVAAHESSQLAAGKRLIDVEQWRPGSTARHCTPQLLLFPQIAGQARTVLASLDQPTALAELLRQSPGLLAARPTAAGQLATLAALAGQARCYRALLGSDVFDEPAAVADLLWAACERNVTGF